jgi:hypothetical protein
MKCAPPVAFTSPIVVVHLLSAPPAAEGDDHEHQYDGEGHGGDGQCRIGVPFACLFNLFVGDCAVFLSAVLVLVARGRKSSDVGWAQSWAYLEVDAFFAATKKSRLIDVFYKREMPELTMRIPTGMSP